MNIEIINSFYKKAASLKNISTLELQILNEIKKELRNLSSNGLINFLHGKILFNHQFIVILSRKSIFKKNSVSAHNLTLKLRKEKLISNKSILYPSNSKFFSTNPLSNCFLNLNMKTLEIVSEILENLITDESLSQDLKLYFYLRAFYIKRISPDCILRINDKTVFDFKNNCSLFVYVGNEDSTEYRQIKVYFLDDISRKLYNSMLSNNIIFNDSINYYEKELNKYLSHNNLSLTSIRISIEYLYQLNNTALDLTIEKANIYPKITLKEINYLFPNLIPESLINIENRNESIYLHTSNKINEEDEIDDVNNTINDYIIKDFSKFDELKKIIKVPKEIKNIDTYFNKCYKFLENGFNDDNELLNMFSRYMIFMLKKADKRDSSHNIKLSTMTDYFSITIKYAFNFIIAEGELTDRTIAYIYENIQNNDNLTVKTKKKYRRVVNFFLRNFTTYSSIAKINMALDVRRSIIFKEELDILIERLISNDKFKYQNEKDIKIKSIYRSVFTLLLFYTGLRKTELRTRLSKDIYFLDEETLVIDVNSQGFRETMKSTNEKELKLKSNNAKRRVKVIIEDKNHLRIIRQYINFIESKKYKFLFPLINENCTFMKKHVITENLIIDISKELQSITKRYTPLHSLRHSFATNYFVRNKAKNNPKMVYELSNILGHSEPNITIENYLHLDFLKILTI